MLARTPWWISLWLLVALACATVPKRGTTESLKSSVETFHQRIRWRDFRGASELVLAERRDRFLAARATHHDDKDLSITDYQLEDMRLATDGLSAAVVSRIGWMRLPSVSEVSDLITSTWVFRGGTWYLARQDVGPFDPELEDPLEAPDGGE